MNKELNRRQFLKLAGAAVGVELLAACGGSGSGEPTVAPTPEGDGATSEAGQSAQVTPEQQNAINERVAEACGSSNVEQRTFIPGRQDLVWKDEAGSTKLLYKGEDVYTKDLKVAIDEDSVAVVDLEGDKSCSTGSELFTDDTLRNSYVTGVDGSSFAAENPVFISDSSLTSPRG